MYAGHSLGRDARGDATSFTADGRQFLMCINMWWQVKQHRLKATTDQPGLLCRTIRNIPGNEPKVCQYCGETEEAVHSNSRLQNTFLLQYELSDKMGWAWRRQLQRETDVSRERCEHKTHDSLGIMGLCVCVCLCVCVFECVCAGSVCLCGHLYNRKEMHLYRHSMYAQCVNEYMCSCLQYK